VKHVPYFPPRITVPPVTALGNGNSSRTQTRAMDWLAATQLPSEPHSASSAPLQASARKRWELKCLCLPPLPHQQHTCHIPLSPALCSGTHSVVFLKPAPRLASLYPFYPSAASQLKENHSTRQGQFWGRSQEHGWSRVKECM